MRFINTIQTNTSRLEPTTLWRSAHHRNYHNVFLSYCYFTTTYLFIITLIINTFNHKCAFDVYLLLSALINDLFRTFYKRNHIYLPPVKTHHCSLGAQKSILKLTLVQFLLLLHFIVVQTEKLNSHF